MPYPEIKLLHFASLTGKNKNKGTLLYLPAFSSLLLSRNTEMTVPSFPHKPGQRMVGNLEITIPINLGRLLYFKVFLLYYHTIYEEI